MTEKTLPLEEAPFWKYLEILREQGYEEDAEISETFYVELLTTVKTPTGEPFTREQVMNAKFKNLVRAAEIIIENTQKEINEISELTSPNMPLTGKVLAGKGADKLSEESLMELARRQAVYHEENKISQAMK